MQRMHVEKCVLALIIMKGLKVCTKKPTKKPSKKERRTRKDLDILTCMCAARLAILMMIIPHRIPLLHSCVNTNITAVFARLAIQKKNETGENVRRNPNNNKSQYVLILKKQKGEKTIFIIIITSLAS